MCVHDRVCPFGVWQIARGSPLCRGDSMGTRLTLGKAAVRGPSLLPVVHGGQQACAARVVRVAGRRCLRASCSEPACLLCLVCVTQSTNPQRLIHPQDCALKTCQVLPRQWLSFPC